MNKQIHLFLPIKIDQNNASSHIKADINSKEKSIIEISCFKKKIEKDNHLRLINEYLDCYRIFK